MLTFEIIRDMERRERENKRIQKLPDNFIEDLKEYLRKKEKIDKTSNDLMEIENVKATVKRFFDLREQKIVELALFTARTGMPVENLTEKERNLYLELVENIKRHRENFFEDIQKEHIVREITQTEIEAKTEEKNSISSLDKTVSSENTRNSLELQNNSVHQNSNRILNVYDPNNQKIAKYKVSAKVPAFVGPDMKVYELKEGEFVDLPKALNDLLLKKGVIETIYL